MTDTAVTQADDDGGGICLLRGGLPGIDFEANLPHDRAGLPGSERRQDQPCAPPPFQDPDRGSYRLRPDSQLVDAALPTGVRRTTRGDGCARLRATPRFDPVGRRRCGSRMRDDLS